VSDNRIVRIRNEHVTHPERSFRYLRYEVDRFRLERHRHRQLELTWIERGTGMRFVGDNVAPFTSGDLVLLGVDVPHAWVSAGASDPNACIASVIQFPIELISQASFPELARARPLAERARVGLQIGGRCAESVQAVLGSMPAANAFRQLACLIEIIGLMSTHPADLAPIATSPQPAAAPGVRARQIDRVTEWIARNMRRELRVVEAARLAGVSPGAFPRFFRREAGKPFSTYVNDVRCGEACLKLRQSRGPIAAIAEQCGFRSISHFNRQFRRRLGATPREYRRHG
jgi:AraC-like DNA-binding protein